MTGRTRVSSVASSRIHNSYVDRVKTVSRAATIEEVEAIDKVKNQTSYGSANYLIASDYFYENLKALKKEYKRFYHDHRKLEEAIKNLEGNDEKLVEHMQELIEKYNDAIGSLRGLDKILNTNHRKEVEDIVDIFRKLLNNIGITVNEEYVISMEKEKFIEKIELSRDPVTFLFEPMKGMIIQLYKAFKNIRLPIKEGIAKEYTNIALPDVSGLLLDKQS
ncbi:hypothetical protein SAMN05446037_102427 [Anaerovirgula multivorans]|uniref:Uncharacterized protein n=1 Tax=Anaerovirgula multivorans TaxID=312168 RepID=A0A239HVU3_9FIRM|nr:hypothetical protein [Anaerovirgula multivorans]SNS85496.1 hypothetical protein SAMN05446037_102427 [Anaerovirgula multivorans]